MKKITMVLISFAGLTTVLGFLKKQPDMQQQNVTGEYALSGIPEMAARFKFNNDQTFQFMYIYGASDRNAHGTYSVENNRIILHGSKTAGKDFELVEEKQSGDRITVSIADENDMLLNNVVVYFLNGKDTVVAETNAEGIASANMPGCQEIQLIHGYFPDLPTSYKIKGNSNNFFQFSLKPSLSEVVFDNVPLVIKDGHIEGSNIYLFGEQPAAFDKVNENDK